MKFKSERQRKKVMMNYNTPRFRNQSYKGIWTGDWDKDGIPNIDDTRPFKPSTRHAHAVCTQGHMEAIR